MILENIEGLADWNIRPDWKEWRTLGLSAMVRLKDEAEYCIPALDSIAGWCDEIVIALQGEQSDGTDRLVEGWARTHPHARVLRYPFDSVPNGPGHGDQPRGSVHERAYFYNWCLSQTTRSHVLKWDGDMVALDGLGEDIRKYLGKEIDVVEVGGVEIVKGRFRSQGKPFIGPEVRVFPADMAEFVTGEMSEVLVLPELRHRTPWTPSYLHFKWSKQFSSATKAWPANWRDLPHFVAIFRRALPGHEWTGRWPSVLPDPREKAA